MLLPLLLLVFALFLEGPPTRLVVRGWPFIVACFSLSLLTAQFVQQLHRLHPAVVAIPAIIVPAGYVRLAQAYYHGGKNTDYHQLYIIFFILMWIIGLVYLSSLFIIQPRKAKTDGKEAGSADNFAYDVTLYSLDSAGQRGSIIGKEQGKNNLPDFITVDGFSKDITIDLRAHWDSYLDDDDLEEYSTEVITHETIVKFGKPIQLVNNYQLVLKIN